MINQAMWWKAQLLSNGVALSDEALDNYDSKFIEKRSAYGIQDPCEYRVKRVPQEIIIQPEKLMCAANINPMSANMLNYSSDMHCFFLENNLYKRKTEVLFPIRPDFYDKHLISDPSIRINQIISLYGGHSLGAFLIRNCWLEKNGVCHFCSLCNNHGKENDFFNLIKTDVLIESIEIALSEKYPIKQIMLNGGNLSSLDDNFIFYVERALAVRSLLDRLGRTDIEIHLIVSPPRDLELLECLRGSNIKLAINMETYDDDLFSVFCPGKSKFIGHGHILNALKKSVDVLGTEKVYSILVGGLEPLNSLRKGIEYLTDVGVVPVINVLHVDPNTLVSANQSPSLDSILNMGEILQTAYSQLSPSFIPFYYECGRNSLDTEAFKKLFDSGEEKYYG